MFFKKKSVVLTEGSCYDCEFATQNAISDDVMCKYKGIVSG